MENRVRENQMESMGVAQQAETVNDGEDQDYAILAREIVTLIMDEVLDHEGSGHTKQPGTRVAKKSLVIKIPYGQSNRDAVANILKRRPYPDKTSSLKLAAVKGNAVKRANQIRKVAQPKKVLNKQDGDEDTDESNSVSTPAPVSGKKFFHSEDQFERLKESFISNRTLSNEKRKELAIEISLDKKQVDRFFINARHGKYAFARDLLGIEDKAQAAKKSKKAKEAVDGENLVGDLKDADEEYLPEDDATISVKLSRASERVRKAPRKSYAQETLHETDEEEFITTPTVSSRQKLKRPALAGQDKGTLFPNLKPTTRASSTNSLEKKLKLNSRKPDTMEYQSGEDTPQSSASSSRAVGSNSPPTKRVKTMKSGDVNTQSVQAAAPGFASSSRSPDVTMADSAIAPFKAGNVSAPRSGFLFPSGKPTVEDSKNTENAERFKLQKVQSELESLRFQSELLENKIKDEQFYIEAGTREVNQLEAELKKAKWDQDTRKQIRDLREAEREELRMKIEAKVAQEAHVKATLEDVPNAN